MSNATKYTAEQLKGLNSTDLRKAGTDLGIKSSSKYSKEELLALCVKAVEGNTSSVPSETKVTEEKKKPVKAEVAPKVKVEKVEPKKEKVVKEKMKRAPRIEYATVSSKMQKIIDGDGKPSDKMKDLFEAGMPIAQITKVLDTHYSFVRGTIQRAAKSELFTSFSEALESLGETPKPKELNKLTKAAIVSNTEKFGEKFIPTMEDLEELVEKMSSKIEDEELLNAYVGQLDNPDWM